MVRGLPTEALAEGLRERHKGRKMGRNRLQSDQELIENEQE